MQKCINTLWNHNIFEGSFVPKKYYLHIRTSLTERYKQCAAKQALQNVKSQRKRTKKTKPVICKATLELDQRFAQIKKGNNTFDLWIKISILGGRPIYLPTKRHHHFNSFYNKGWELLKSCRLRRTKQGFFLDVFFEKQLPPIRKLGEMVGLDLGFRKLAVISDGQIVGGTLKQEIERFYRRKKSHLIIKEHINSELKKIDFTRIRVLVIERLRDVKKGRSKKARKYKKKRRNRYTNRLLSHWAYRHACTKLELLCEENRVFLIEVYPYWSSQVCHKCGSRGIRRDEKFVCPACGYKGDADYNAACNIRDRGLSLGVYGPQSSNYFPLVPVVSMEEV